MCVRVHWPRVVLLSSTLLATSLGAACGAGRGAAMRYDDLDRSSLVRGAACDRSDQDTTHYLHPPLYRACAVTIAARRIANDMRPDFWSRPIDNICLSALVEVAVDTLGRPELHTTRLVRASDPRFGAEVLAIVPGLRFQPARLGDRRVRQIYELREVFRVQRGRGLERARTSGTRTLPSTATLPVPPTSPSEVPVGADVPSLQGLSSVC